ncbi:MAG: arsenate reductase (glutaredoxin) [Lewinellaceae bacterium]|nr:arsenate reductase (glutaredoxin) [Phaeodactylibacter sp.]MCB9041420.1 arsenate reductase (glutaredoxin) [Lewinellaceae bacterium]
MKIYHNPRCRKSREALAILEDKGLNPEIVLYLQTPPSREELKNILQMLGIEASELVRKGEGVYKENYKGKALTDEEWLDAMVQYPKLIERPIVVQGRKAVIGRPPEKVEELL